MLFAWTLHYVHEGKLILTRQLTAKNGWKMSDTYICLTIIEGSTNVPPLYTLKYLPILFTPQFSHTKSYFNFEYHSIKTQTPQCF